MASQASHPSVVVVGAGVGGLAAAIRLAARGFAVEVFERHTTIGGKLNRVIHGPWRFDTGPSLLTMPDVARDLFAAGGAVLDDALDLVALDPICRYVYPDGVTFDAPGDLDRMAAALESFSERDAAGFVRFMDTGRRMFDLTAGPFLHAALGSPFSVAGQFLRRLNRPGALARALAPRSLDALVRRHFADPHLRQLFDRYATYTGSSPYQTPAIYALVPFVEYQFGAWYPRGGMYRLAEALGELAARLGVRLHTGRAVARIVCRDGRARGVETVDGEVVRADAVISNADVITTYQRLLAKEDRPARTLARLARLEPSLSGFVLLLGVNRHYDQLAHHTIFFAADYPQEFADIFTRLVPPRDPTIYVCATTRTDASQGPPGGENLFVLVNAPHLSRECNWDAEREPYRDLVLAKLERLGLSDLRRHIVFEQVCTPEDWQARYGAHLGAIYGFAANSRRAPFQRPGNRAPDIQRLYFVGGSAHPGGGLPLVMLSGQIVAGLVAADVGN